MNIREFAEHSGLTAHTLRYYERVGLMGSIGREANGHRVYGPQDSQWVTFLHHLRETGMSIREMQRYCALRDQGDATLAARLALLERHAEKVAAQLRTQPCTTTPAQPLRAAATARLPPTRARRSEPPASTTSTRWRPGSSSAAFTSELSSKHFTVLTGPAKRRRAP